MDRVAFTAEEAAEYERTWPERTRDRLPTTDDRLTQADVDDTYVELEAIKLDGLRTSLIVDPSSGTLPPLLPSAQARAAARPSGRLTILNPWVSRNVACSETSALAGQWPPRRWCQAW